jgi:hypothetical protein
MSTGLKNADAILSAVQGDVQFAVNEGCQAAGDCSIYNAFINSGKPVFHIEYAKLTTNQNGQIVINAEIPALQGVAQEMLRQTLCLERNLPNQDPNIKVNPKAFSTIIKTKLLDGWAFYCDGSYTLTPTMNVNTGGPQYGGC